MDNIIPARLPLEAVLCYVKNNIAHFTTQAIDKQWADDWDK